VLTTVPVWKGKLNEAKLGSSGTVFVAVPRGQGQQLKTTLTRTDPLIAPLTKGQRVGTIRVLTGNNVPMVDLPLLVQEDVPQAGMFGRAWDSLRLWLK
jgi:D-alanyl-D-alanine carboxypeptidase (penicillin-binding protein 5/6)